MQEEGLDEIVLSKMGLEDVQPVNLTQWTKFLTKLQTATEIVRIGLVGKYVELPDAYKSIIESLIHASAYNEPN